MTTLWPYPAYRHSGVPWVGEVPQQWAVARLRYLARIETGGRDTVDSTLDGSYPFFVRSQTVEAIDTFSYDCEAVLTAGDGAGVGKVFHHFTGKFEAHQRVYVMHAFRRISGRFFYYYFQNLFSKVALDGGAKSTVDSLRRPVLADFPVTVPTASEQQDIVAFLDRQTAQIDDLIGKQERLIALLAEKRQAVITHAVTTGLDPAAPTTPSGIPWLGEIPNHWTKSRVKWTRPVQESGTSVNGMDIPAGSDEIGVLKTGAVSKGYFVPEANKTVVPEDIDRVTCPVRGGTLIVNRANTPDLVGSTGRTTCDAPSLFLSDKLWQIDFERADTNFIYWWSKTDVYRSQIQFRRVGVSSSMQNLSYPDFLTVDIALPSLEEQQIIARYVDGRTASIDFLENRAQEAIVLLRERRSALISAAVTGKIDVQEGAA